MKTLLNIRLLLLGLIVIGCSYLFYCSANRPAEVEHKLPNLIMPSVISPLAQPVMIAYEETEEEETKKSLSALSLQNLVRVRSNISY
jgi:hypothetical protein